MIRSVDRATPRTGRKKPYSGVLIVAIFLWPVEHDRPLCWASRTGQLCELVSSAPTAVSVSVLAAHWQPTGPVLLERVEERLGEVDLVTPISTVDARPLVVGARSKDRVAKPCRVYGGFARGYRLHAVVSQDSCVRAWEVTSLSGAPALNQLSRQIVRTCMDCAAVRDPDMG